MGHVRLVTGLIKDILYNCIGQVTIILNQCVKTAETRIL